MDPGVFLERDGDRALSRGPNRRTRFCLGLLLRDRRVRGGDIRRLGLGQHDRQTGTKGGCGLIARPAHLLGLVVLLRQGRRRGQRQRLEQLAVLDQLRCHFAVGHHHLAAHIGDGEQLGREGIRQADTAMGRGVTRDHTGMKRRAGPRQPLHPWHRRAVIEV